MACREVLAVTIDSSAQKLRNRRRLSSPYLALVTCTVLAVTMAEAACGTHEAGQNPLSSVGHKRADVIRDSGEPAVDRPAEKHNPFEPCRNSVVPPATRVLEYHFYGSRAEAFIRTHLGMKPAKIIYVCLDGSDTVIYTAIADVH